MTDEELIKEIKALTEQLKETASLTDRLLVEIARKVYLEEARRNFPLWVPNLLSVIALLVSAFAIAKTRGWI